VQNPAPTGRPGGARGPGAPPPWAATRPTPPPRPATPIARTIPPTTRPAGTPSSGGWKRHLDSRYGTNPAILPGAIQKNTNDPSTAPTVLVTLLLPNHASVFAERSG